MNRRILCVDDEPHVLDAYRRGLRQQFEVETAGSGPQGLEAIAARASYAVIVSDMRMPGMDGVQFLSKVREIAPASVRIMLTGNADQHTAIEAVNEGHIFRFLTKPCPPEQMAKALNAGIEQYRLITAEKELLEKTLNGSIKALTEVLSLVNPEAFGRSSRISRLVTAIAAHMGLAGSWQIHTAAMLSQVGGIVLPETLLSKLAHGHPLDPEERQLFEQHPFVASDLLGKIPRMQEVAGIIAYQEKRWDGSGIPRDSRKGEDIPMGARLLKVALDFDVLESAGCPKGEVYEHLKQRSGWYDPAVLEALKKAFLTDIKYEGMYVAINALAAGMILAEDIKDDKGLLLVAKGQDVTESLTQRLHNYVKSGRLSELIRVHVPVDESTPAAV
jgi:response regulator RpfG family c-di-GMP phosphodiesterase